MGLKPYPFSRGKGTVLHHFNKHFIFHIFISSLINNNYHTSFFNKHFKVLKSLKIQRSKALDLGG